MRRRRGYRRRRIKSRQPTRASLDRCSGELENKFFFECRGAVEAFNQFSFQQSWFFFATKSVLYQGIVGGIVREDQARKGKSTNPVKRECVEGGGR